MTAGTLVDLTPLAAEKVLELRGEDPAKSFLRVFVAGQGCCSVRYGMSFAESVDSGDSSNNIVRECLVGTFVPRRYRSALNDSSTRK